MDNQMPSRIHPSVWIGVVLLTIGLALTVAVVVPLYRAPDYEEMRKHVLSKMSDEQIRSLHEEALVEYERTLQRDRSQQDKDASLAMQRQARCSDIVYKERNPDACRTTGFIFPPRPTYSSAEQVYEGMIMGVCRTLTSVKEAKSVGCLP